MCYKNNKTLLNNIYKGKLKDPNRLKTISLILVFLNFSFHIFFHYIHFRRRQTFEFSEAIFILIFSMWCIAATYYQRFFRFCRHREFCGLYFADYQNTDLFLRNEICGRSFSGLKIAEESFRKTHCGTIFCGLKFGKRFLRIYCCGKNFPDL